jgi:hypothetical protein
MLQKEIPEVSYGSGADVLATKRAKHVEITRKSARSHAPRVGRMHQRLVQMAR